MLEAIVGTPSAERVLMFITARSTGYASEIARTFDTDLTSVKNQLVRMERDGLLISDQVGRVTQYRFNPRYAFVSEVTVMVEKAIGFLPDSLRDTLLMDRRRPRKKGKPL